MQSWFVLRDKPASRLSQRQAFKGKKWSLLFLLFPTFLLGSYFSLLFLEHALLSLLFCKNSWRNNRNVLTKCIDWNNLNLDCNKKPFLVFGRISLMQRVPSVARGVLWYEWVVHVDKSDTPTSCSSHHHVVESPIEALVSKQR